MRIVNLTNHEATDEQKEEGVFEAEPRERVMELLTFGTCPDRQMIEERARDLAGIAKDARAEAAMIGGAPYLMAPLEKALMAKCVKPVYAYSARISKEEMLADGSVKKVQFFRHEGWVWT